MSLTTKLFGCAALTVMAGCWLPDARWPSAHTESRNYSYGDYPVDPPHEEAGGKYDDYVSGGRLFQMYCGACHNARPLAERPFAMYENALAHMREQAYLTGKEYRKIVHFLRRWNDLDHPSLGATPDVSPSPKRFFFSQPLVELREQDEPAKSTNESSGDKPAEELPPPTPPG